MGVTPSAPVLTGAATHRLGKILVLQPLGRWDATNALAFLQWTQSLLHERYVIVPMNEMAYMDAAAYEYLVELLSSLVSRGGDVALVAPTPAVRARLAVAGLDLAFPIFATEGDAARHLRKRDWI